MLSDGRGLNRRQSVERETAISVGDHHSGGDEHHCRGDTAENETQKSQACLIDHNAVLHT